VNYSEALAYIYSLTDYERLTRHPGSFCLDRIARLLGRLGDPQHAYPSFLIAGTKGKGSTAALMASVLRENGYRVGLYTQPHLHSYRERIQVDGKPIPPEDVAAGVAALHPAIEAMSAGGEIPSTYEATTALAFRYFALEKIDVAVLEVGLGGRLDATNIVKPVVSVIAPVSLDHTEVLGETVDRIAWEKAGIIKEFGFVATAQTYPEALAVVKEVAAQKHARVATVGKEVAILHRWISFDHVRALSQTLTLGFDPSVMPPAWPSKLTLEVTLLGIHQAINASLAALALGLAMRTGQVVVDVDALVRGFRSVVWPARMEVLRLNPIVVVDGAHNRDSMRSLMVSLREEFTYRSLVVVFGASADKDIQAMADEIAVEADLVIVTRSRHPRAASPERIADCCRRTGLQVSVAKSVDEALRQALDRAGPEDLICVTGSLFVAAEAREVLGVAVEGD
jgi:dihydrofolate synthase/folylpolyglutamate synthase